MTSPTLKSTFQSIFHFPGKKSQPNLNQKIAVARQEVEKSRQNLSNFMKEHGIVYMNEENTARIENMKQSNAKKAELMKSNAELVKKIKEWETREAELTHELQQEEAKLADIEEKMNEDDEEIAKVLELKEELLKLQEQKKANKNPLIDEEINRKVQIIKEKFLQLESEEKSREEQQKTKISLPYPKSSQSSVLPQKQKSGESDNPSNKKASFVTAKPMNIVQPKVSLPPAKIAQEQLETKPADQTSENIQKLVPEDFEKVRDWVTPRFESIKKIANDIDLSEPNQNLGYRPFYHVLKKYLSVNPNSTLEEALDYLFKMFKEKGARINQKICIYN